MKSKRKLKAQINKTRWFHVSFQFQERYGSSMSFNSCDLKINRQFPDSEMIMKELKNKFNTDNMVILSCFEILNPNHRQFKGLSNV